MGKDCCDGNHKNCMMAMGVIVALIGLLWLLGDLGYIAFTFPWLPLLVLLFGLKLLYITWKH